MKKEREEKKNLWKVGRLNVKKDEC